MIKSYPIIRNTKMDIFNYNLKKALKKLQNKRNIILGVNYQTCCYPNNNIIEYSALIIYNDGN